MGYAGRYRDRIAKWLSHPWSCACLGFLLSDLALGRVDYVRSSDPAVGRSASLHDRPNHLMGHSARSVSYAFRAPPYSRKLQECVPGIANAEAQTVEGGCRGKCFPSSDSSTVPASLFEHSVSCSHFPRN